METRLQKRIRLSKAEAADVKIPAKNPLNNEYIMEEIFSYLPVNDLKECRAVNRAWNYVATRAMIPKTKVVSLEEDNAEAGSMDLARLTTTVEDSWRFPCTKFAIGSALHVGSSIEEKVGVQTFLELVAPTVTHLKVSCELGLYLLIKPEKDMEFSKLKSLELVFNPFPGKENRKAMELVDYVTLILERSPQLVSVSLTLPGPGQGGNDPLFSHLARYIPWRRITHLGLFGVLVDTRFQRLRQLNAVLNLKSLQVVTHATQEGLARDNHFSRFMGEQGRRLQSLQISLWLMTLGSTFYIPEMRRLKNLDIFVDTNQQGVSIIAMSQFADKFPVVSSFRLSGSVISITSDLPSEKVVDLTLDHSRFDWDQTVPTAGGENATTVIRRAAHMFPRVRKLSIAAHPELIQAIESEGAWKDLEELTLIVNDHYTVDYGLTGLSEEERKKIQDLLSNRRTSPRSLRLLERNMKKLAPNFLKKLTVLTVELRGSTRRDFLTDFTCQNVLLKMRGRLQCLNITSLGTDKHQVSDMMLRQMQAKFNVAYEPKRMIRGEQE